MPLVLILCVIYCSGYYPLISNSLSFDAKILEVKKIKLKHVDIMSIGSSVTLNNLDGRVIEDSLQRPYYNFGAWGLQVGDLNHLIKSYTTTYKPKYVLYPSNFADFEDSLNVTLPKDLYAGICLTPIYYLKNYTNYKDIIERKDQLDFYRKAYDNFIDLHFDNTGGILLNVSKKNADSIRVKFIYNLLNKFPDKYTPSAYKGLDSIALFLQQHKIKFVFIQYPFAGYFIKTKQKQIFIQSHFNTCKKIVESRGGIYLNMEQACQYPDSLFADPLHFNSKGASFITKKIVSKLKLTMNKNY
jgi:hypothetical protein